MSARFRRIASNCVLPFKVSVSQSADVHQHGHQDEDIETLPGEFLVLFILGSELANNSFLLFITDRSCWGLVHTVDIPHHPPFCSSCEQAGS